MPGETPRYGERLWTEVAADRVATALDGIAPRFETLPGVGRLRAVPRPYRLVGAVVLFDIFVLHSVQQLTVGSNTVLDNPSWLALPGTVLLAVFMNRYARDRYDRACREVRIETRTASGSTEFQRLVPRRFKRALLAVTVTGYYAYMILSGRIPTIIEYEGLAGLFGWLVIIPFAYAPILLETASIYLSLHFSLPRRFERADVKIYYFDPHNLGGLRPMGELLKHSFYLFVIALVALTVLLYAPFLFPDVLYTPYQPPEWFITGVLTALWAIGVCSIGFSLLTIHRYMRDRRRTELQTLESRFHELVKEPYNVRDALKDSEELERFEREQHRIGQVRETREFPATTAMWLQIIISGVVPLVIQWGIRWLDSVL